jgi:cytochrome P450
LEEVEVHLQLLQQVQVVLAVVELLVKQQELEPQVKEQMAVLDTAVEITAQAAAVELLSVDITVLPAAVQLVEMVQHTIPQ